MLHVLCAHMLLVLCAHVLHVLCAHMLHVRLGTHAAHLAHARKLHTHIAPPHHLNPPLKVTNHAPHTRTHTPERVYTAHLHRLASPSSRTRPPRCDTSSPRTLAPACIIPSRRTAARQASRTSLPLRPRAGPVTEQGVARRSSCQNTIGTVVCGSARVSSA